MIRFAMTMTFTAVLLGSFLATPSVANEEKNEVGFGTLKKIDPKGQRLQVTSYNWETLEIEDTNYIFNRRRLEIFNLEAITDLKPGDEIEFEWMVHGNRKYIVKLSKGPMPMEEVELLWDPSVIPEDVDVADAPPVEGDSAAEGSNQAEDQQAEPTTEETPKTEE